jgi:hypothetical protein
MLEIQNALRAEKKKNIFKRKKKRKKEKKKKRFFGWHFGSAGRASASRPFKGFTRDSTRGAVNATLITGNPPFPHA